MIDLLILAAALLAAGWATLPPRGEQRAPLFTALLALWGALVAVGLRRGVLPGFIPWLLVLSAIGALVALLVVWSLSNLMARPKSRAEAIDPGSNRGADDP